MTTNRFGSNLRRGSCFASALALVVAFGGSSARAQTAPAASTPAPEPPAADVPTTAPPAVTPEEASPPSALAPAANTSDAAKASEAESARSAASDAEAVALEAELNRVQILDCVRQPRVAAEVWHRGFALAWAGRRA